MKEVVVGLPYLLVVRGVSPHRFAATDWSMAGPG